MVNLVEKSGLGIASSRVPGSGNGEDGIVRVQVLVIRLILGILFGVLLSRVFFPASGRWLIFVFAGLLVFFAYCFELLHKRERR